MHDKRIVHRDIKIDNILIFQGGNAKLTDFSVSLPLDNPDTRLLKLGTTKIYQAPEVWINPDELSYPNDIWSLGVVLFEMLFDRLPFISQNEMNLKNEIIKYQLELPESLGEDLRNLLMGLFNRDKKLRWTIEQVADCYWLKEVVSVSQK